MKHKDCGGTIRESQTLFYEDETGRHPALFCMKCNKEILGDPEIDLGDFEQYLPSIY